MSSAVTPAAAPNAPANVIATRGNEEATITFDAPANNGSALTDYIIEYKPASGSWTTFNDGTSTNLTATITGLTNGTSYTFRVSAVNAIGTSVASSTSNAVIPALVPDVPTNIQATRGNGQATITFDIPADNGSTITQYTVTSNEGHFATGTTSGITVTGLTNGVEYTFTVTATNIVGTSASSTSSNAVTPATTPNAPTNVSATR